MRNYKASLVLINHSKNIIKFINKEDNVFYFFLVIHLLQDAFYEFFTDETAFFNDFLIIDIIKMFVTDKSGML